MISEKQVIDTHKFKAPWGLHCSMVWRWGDRGLVGSRIPSFSLPLPCFFVFFLQAFFHQIFVELELGFTIIFQGPVLGTDEEAPPRDWKNGTR